MKPSLSEVMLNYELNAGAHVITIIKFYVIKEVSFSNHHLHNSCMACKDCFCINDTIFFWSGINVPETNSMII
jgi:hypothetical protein